MTRRTPLLALVLVLTCLAGCTSTPPAWRNPAVPSDQWAAEVDACRRWATRESERDVVRADYGGTGITSAGDYRTLMTRYEIGKQRDALTARCLRAKGYVPAAQ